MATELRVISLGGIGEVGKNSTVIETDQDLILVDAGVMFPRDDMYGIDLVIPNYDYVLDNLDRLRGIVLTHGHDDHVGALPYLLQQLDGQVPVYGTALTLGLAANRARETRVLDKADWRPLTPGQQVRLGSLTLELFHVCHSVPAATGMILHTPAGTLVHTGDFKLDPTPIDGKTTDLARLRQIGDSGVLVLLSDCVRAEQPGRTPSERVVGETLDRLISQAKGRVIVTTFASNITRLAQTVRIAERYGRKVAVAGRSIAQNLTVAQEYGYADLPSGVVVDINQANKLPPEQVVLLTTGSQGEPTSALARIAAGDHQQIEVGPEDTVIISANPIPGNEETVAHTIDNLFRRGARVIYGAVAEGVHVSGHASRDELREVLGLVRPRYAVPMHGEYRHMVLYRALAREEGMSEQDVLLPKVGEVLHFSAEEARAGERVASGAVLVDGLSVGGVTQSILRERGRLAERGLLIVSVVVDRESGMLLTEPELITRGLPEQDDGVLQEARESLLAELQSQGSMEAERGYIVRKIHDVVGRLIYQRTRFRPMILPVVTEI
ncbi:MAG: ribonuclease J [Chloroflexota bacterium]